MALLTKNLVVISYGFELERKDWARYRTGHTVNDWGIPDAVPVAANRQCPVLSTNAR